MRIFVKRQGRWQILSNSQSLVFDTNMKVYDPELVYYRDAKR